MPKKNISDHLERRRTAILRGDNAQRQNWGAVDETSDDHRLSVVYFPLYQSDEAS